MPTRSPLPRFILVALVVMGVDLVSKAVASAFLGFHGVVPVAERLTLMLVYNMGNAGGGTIGPFTWHLNVGLTAMAVVLMSAVVEPLALVDRRAIYALGAVTGGALGNLASLLFGPPGVADFLGVHLPSGSLVVANVADLALWAGALLLVPVALSIVRALRDDPRPLLQATPRAPVQNPM